MTSRSALLANHVDVKGDNAWQQRARLLQALWRERQGLPAGLHRSAPLGSRLTAADGEPPVLANYLSAPAKRQVQAAVAESAANGALLSRPRLWVDLLSSQPLCFNLFGPLAEDKELATSALQLLWPHIEEVTDIRFEWSPGRGEERYTANRSAFDVFVAYRGPAGRGGFLGIEVKYHEDLSGARASDPHQRYPRIARKHGIFTDGTLPDLQRRPLQQIWLDHLLALQLLTSPEDNWDEATFVLLYPIGNIACAAAAQRYRRCLTDATTYDARTLDEVVHAVRLITSDPWITDLYERYLDPGPIHDLA